jgi:hypothetical protein
LTAEVFSYSINNFEKSCHFFNHCLFSHSKRKWKVQNQPTTQKSPTQLTATLAVTATLAATVNRRGVEVQANRDLATRQDQDPVDMVESRRQTSKKMNMT